MENSKHYLELEKSQRWPWWCVHLRMVFLFVTLFSDSNGQTVTVNMNNTISDVPSNSATVLCEFRINDPTYTFSNLVWRKGSSTTLAHFAGGAAVPTYLNYCTSPGPCTITRDSSSSHLILSPVDRTRDDGNDYVCQVTYSKSGDIKLEQATASLTVVVPTKTMVMSNGSSSDEFTDGSEVKLSLDVASHIFQCVVADINPQATFTWTVGGDQLSSDSITESHVVDSTGLTTSTSNATLTPKQDYDGRDLICKAVNYEGDPGVVVQLVLKVADPCVGVECENGGTCVIDQNDTSMTECECPVGYEGKICEIETSSAERTSFRIEMIAIQCVVWMVFNYMYL